VYPWAALLGDDRKAGHADGAGPVPDQVGKPTGIHGDQAAVEHRPPVLDGRLLTLGEPATEMARLALDGPMPARGIGPGEWVSLHWDWVSDKLTQRQLCFLRMYTMRHLDVVNYRVERPAPSPCWAEQRARHSRAPCGRRDEVGGCDAKYR
jgi:hypothetical protein